MKDNTTTWHKSKYTLTHIRITIFCCNQKRIKQRRGALNFTEHTCSMLIMWGPKALVHLGSLICFMLLVVEVTKKIHLDLAWLGPV